MTQKKKFFYFGLMLLFLFLFFQAAYIAYSYIVFRNAPQHSSYQYAAPSSDQGTLFDPIRGCKIPLEPIRFMRVTNGQIEFSSISKGNNQFFPDCDDWVPERSDTTTSRWAVFGDSFTAAQYIAKNWPDAVENATRNLELLNFSMQAIGLANWYSTLVHILQKEAYDIDGVIFAIYPGNLQRGFTFSCLLDSQTLGYARSGFNPKHWPKTIQDARKKVKASYALKIVSPKEYDYILKHKTHRFQARLFGLKELPMLLNKLIPDFLKDFFHLLFDQSHQTSMLVHEIYPPNEEKDRLALMHVIRDYITQNTLETLVIDIPDRQQLLSGAFSPNVEAIEFANILGATHINYPATYKGVDTETILSHYFDYDGHWNQVGSDRFAEFFAREVVPKYILRPDTARGD